MHWWIESCNRCFISFPFFFTPTQPQKKKERKNGKKKQIVCYFQCLWKVGRESRIRFKRLNFHDKSKFLAGKRVGNMHEKTTRSSCVTREKRKWTKFVFHHMSHKTKSKKLWVRITWRVDWRQTLPTIWVKARGVQKQSQKNEKRLCCRVNCVHHCPHQRARL